MDPTDDATASLAVVTVLGVGSNNSGREQQRSSDPAVDALALPTWSAVQLTEDGSGTPSRPLILGELLRSVSGGGGGGARPDMDSLRSKLLRDWAPSGKVHFLRVTDGAFLVQFHEEADRLRAMGGAPWPCGGVGIFFRMQLVEPDKNLLDQLVGVVTADRGGVGPCGCDSRATSPSADSPPRRPSPRPVQQTPSRIAAGTRIRFRPHQQQHVRFQDSPAEFLVRSRSVDVDGGRRPAAQQASDVQAFCESCGIINDPNHRCPPRRRRPPFGTPSPSASPSAGGAPSRLGSSSSGRWSSGEAQPEDHHQEIVEEDGDPSAIPLLPLADGSTTEMSRSSSQSQSQVQPLLESPPPASRPFVVRTARCGCLSCDLLKLILPGKIKETALQGKKKKKKPPPPPPRTSGVNNTQGSTAAVQESIGMETDETPPDSTRSPSISECRGGIISCSWSITRPRTIEVKVETQVSPQLISKAMEWISKKTAGLEASYDIDGKKGKISILGLQIDKKMGPIDLVVHLHPDIRAQTGRNESQRKPNTPARFEDFMSELYCRRCGKST